jgi:hypothetical protein
MLISPAEFATYPLPAFLQGKCGHSEYLKWLNNKTDTLFKRDKKRGKPYVATSSEFLALCKNVVEKGLND